MTWEPFVKFVWSTATFIGMRRLCAWLPKSAYGDTVCYFSGESAKGFVALTIDDGLCRNGASRSMADEVVTLLRRHSAHATFFVCTKYLEGCEVQAQTLVANGHELGNHMGEDLNFVYPKMEPSQFDAALADASASIERTAPGAKVRWFRAPQGVLTASMAEAVSRQGLKHALGDCYSDDWALEHNAKFVARTLLKQATDGSILILHMPERGFREHTFKVLKLVLQGLEERNLKPVTLSELHERCVRTAAQDSTNSLI